MTRLKTPRPNGKRPRKRGLRRFVEFQDIRRISFQQYRNRVRQLYDGPAGAVLALGSLVSLHEPLVGHMLRTRRFDVAGFQSVLDVGSGAGQILGHLLKATCPTARLVACDLSPRMLRRARKRVRSGRPQYVAADLVQLPWRDASFDCVTCGWVLEHFPDPKPGLHEMWRVLKPQGRLLLLATEDTFSGAVVSRAWKCRTYNRADLQRACEEVGLTWHEQLWLTRVHRFFRMGGILVEAKKENANGSPQPVACSAQTDCLPATEHRITATV